MSNQRTEILARVHQTQRRHLQQADIADALREIGGPPPVVPGSDNLVGAFLRQLNSQHVTAAVVHDRSAAVKAISEYIYRQYHHRRVVAGNDSRLAALPWRDGGVLVRFDAAGPEDPVSVSYARAGIAESGSLAVYCNRRNPGSNNWLVENHIILLDIEDLVADYENAWARLRAAQVKDGFPRGLSFISGPSSTSDIKVEKVFGAHGPSRLHIVLIGDIVAMKADDSLDQ